MAKGRRGNGEGTITQRKNKDGSLGLWQAAVSLADGSRKYYYGKTRAEVAKKLTEATRARDRGLPVVTDERLTIEQYLREWLDTMRPPHIRASTHLRYTGLLQHVISAYGNLRLTHLTARHLATLYAQLQRPAAEGGAGLSATTAHHVHTVLGGALDAAVRLDLAPINVAERVTAPKMRHAAVTPYTREEAERLFAAAAGHRLEALFVLATLTGMRLGELLALRWRHVDLDTLDGGATIHVIATLTRNAAAQWTIGETKTLASRRRIPLIPRARLALIRHRARQNAERTALDESLGVRVWQDSGLVFTSNIGTLLDEGNVNKQYARLLKRAGLPYRRGHVLRHTCAALLLADGVPLHKVSALLGHASISITANLYGHLAHSDYERDTSESMERLFGASGGDGGADRDDDEASGEEGESVS